jgi:hypothetical protein
VSGEALAGASPGFSSGDPIRAGLLAAPELPTDIAARLATDLAEELAAQHGGAWEVTVAEEPLLEGERGIQEIVEAARERRVRFGWDVAVCLTDLPLRRGTRPVVAAVSPSEGILVVAVPAFGPTRLRPRVREAIVNLTGEVVDEALASRSLVRRRVGDLLTPIQRVNDDGETVAVHWVTPPVLGHFRLLAGMVRANRPWRALVGLTRAVVAAFATGAYALLTNTIWKLSDRLAWERLLLLMVLSVGALVVWLIAANDLWEKSRRESAAKEATLYNAATALTLLVAVLCAYAALFTLLLGTAALVVDARVLRAADGHTVGLVEYAKLAWMAASMATVAGTLGSGLESVSAVRQAAYGHRQLRRAGEAGQGG